MGFFLQMVSYLKHECGQRRAGAVMKAGGLELCPPASRARGRRHICMLLPESTECAAGAFVGDFYPLLWLILHVFV